MRTKRRSDGSLLPANGRSGQGTIAESRSEGEASMADKIRKMPSAKAIRAHWAEKLVELGKVRFG